MTEIDDGTTSPEQSSREQPVNFEEALGQLQGIVRQLEAGSLGLEESLHQFERGMGLIRRCYTTLENVEQRIQILTGIDASGLPITKPFETSATFTSGNSALTSYVAGNEGEQPGEVRQEAPSSKPRRARPAKRPPDAPGFFGADDVD